MQRKPGLFFAVVIILYLGLSVGCHSGPSFNDDSGYRAIEREADRNSVDLAVTGAEIAARVERIDRQENRVRSTLDSLEAALEGADIKDTLYQRLIAVRAEDEALSGEIQWLREDAGRLNEQLAEQREINAAMAEEHDRREAAGAAVKEELAVTKERLVKVSGQRNLAVVIAAALALMILGIVAIRIRRIIRPP